MVWLVMSRPIIPLSLQPTSAAFEMCGASIRANTLETIPGAGELILPSVSHFALLQNPEQFNEALLHFLSRP